MRLSTTINPFIFPNDGTMKPYREDLRRYSELGYDCFDCILCSADNADSPLMQDDWEKWVERYAAEAEKMGIQFGQSHIPFYNFANKAVGRNPRRDEATCRSIVMASRLGAKWIVVHPATATQSAFWTRESKEENLEYFTPLVELGAKHHIGIAIENMADFDVPEIKKRHYAATVEELCDLVDTFDSPYVGICWDFGHANLIYSDQNDCLRYIGKRLKATHVHDNDGKWDAHLAPFFGNIHWEPMMRTLKEIGYTGDFSFEIKRLAMHLPEDLKSTLWTYALGLGRYLLSCTD